MPDLVPVDAGWALWSKQAGTREDYSVLSTSTGQFSRADFSAILTRFTPGTPPTEKEGLGTLPWVTISWVGVGGSLHLGMAVQTASDDADGLGRPITRTQYFCVPYAALKEHRISYTELHDAVKSLQLPPQDGDPVRLLLRRLDPEEAAGSIRELGEPAVETTAGLLLQGPVSVVRAEASTLPERLAFIEAVAALLPYGYRAKFTAATWTDSGSRHRIRLAFAERPRDGAQLVSWRERAADPASDRVFRAYLTQLNRLQQAHPSGTRQAFTLPQIIGYLAADITPQKFEQPDPAVDSLLEIDLPFAVLDAVRAGTAEPARLRRLFAGTRVTELPADGQRTVLEELISYADDEDWPAVERWFGPVAAGRPQALLPTLGKAARGKLWTGSPSRTIRDYLTLAAANGIGDDLLAVLSRKPQKIANLRSGLSHAGQLLNETVIASGQSGDYPQTLEALDRNPALACELIARAADSAGADSAAGAIAAVRWVSQVRKDLATPFAVILRGGSRPVGQQDITQLAASGPECVQALLRVASQIGRIDLLLQGFVSWLSGRGDLDPAEQRYWHDQLSGLEPTQAILRAGIDLALLTLNSEPRWLLVAARQADWAAYANCFSKIWDDLCTRGQCDPARLAIPLSQFLARQQWAADPALARAVMDLTRKLTGKRKLPVLAKVVAGSLTAPDVPDWPFRRQWLAEAERAYPGIVQEGPLILLQSLPPGTDAAPIAWTCIRALRQGIGPGAAVDAVIRSGNVQTVIAAIRIMQELRSALTLDGLAGQQARDWLREFSTAFAHQRFKPDAAAEFRNTMRWIGSGGLWHDLDLLAVNSRTGRNSLDLTGEERANLEDAREYIDSLLRASKKSGLWRPGRYRDGAPDDDRQDASREAGR